MFAFHGLKDITKRSVGSLKKLANDVLRKDIGVARKNAKDNSPRRSEQPDPEVLAYFEALRQRHTPALDSGLASPTGTRQAELAQMKTELEAREARVKKVQDQIRGVNHKAARI